EDHVVGPSFVDRMQVAFPNHRGPFHVPGAGHFLQWERPRILESALVMMAADLLTTRGTPR
ncbi:MAG: hypothetical protein KDB21_12190, partial [Acidimicrobiales bacterium]|nr:hypothetical protein [Acidimicrobiales bacterium]